MADRPTLLGISGSIRAGSYNTAILDRLAELIHHQAELTIFPLNDIPLYNQDLDASNPPQSVANFRDAIAKADGIIIATPEYNYGIPGVLKNALDWASRPYGASTLTSKSVLTLSSSPATTGGVRAQASLNETLTAIAAKIVLRPQIVITSVHERLTDGRITDEATIRFLQDGVNDLLSTIEQNASAPRTKF